MNEKLLALLKKLTDKERDALTSAVGALYFKEEYEKAADLRDQIRRIESGQRV